MILRRNWDKKCVYDDVRVKNFHFNVKTHFTMIFRSWWFQWCHHTFPWRLGIQSSPCGACLRYHKCHLQPKTFKIQLNFSFMIFFSNFLTSVCSPRVPRTCKLYLAATSSSLALLAANFGTLMWTDARMVVPKLVGQNVSCELKGQNLEFSIFRFFLELNNLKWTL